ncbi:N-acetyl-gamma-glutamyl-phosphate reductase [Acidaminococcus timonensis]|uniref:N-acetyl-gamma-glutamyl-phosphate reductase n=1 Tax=Acidaminococcus timonensis TaxID=1871002 RepID=UPI002593408E|nr:N-acetyl-gamma-glutamyl-phosphate reductase [uncultured Acidaminococcus sp.]
MFKVFIDGGEGTTGLRLAQRLKQRSDIELLTISSDLRKNLDARLEKIDLADVAFLCLPDAASREVAEAAKNCDTRIIDTSTAFRCDPDWAYGFPELGPQYLHAIQNSRRISNPGCHATGSIAVLAPLVKAGLIEKTGLYTLTSLTGYSGGGKKMIASYENLHDKELDAPRIYSLGQKHKHLPEILKYTGLEQSPIFLPIVAPYYAGMLVTAGFLMPTDLSLSAIRKLYHDFYRDQAFITVETSEEQPKMLGSNTLAGKDNLKIYICGNEERFTVSAQFDNLGKGASGAAIENMNIAMGLDPATGLEL